MPEPAPLTDAARVLQERWGYDAFRPGQAETIAAVLAGRDALAVLPTGGGKSLCYQVPALVREGVVLVVSPLVALMEDQVQALARRRIPAIALHSARKAREIEQAFVDAEFGRYRLVYLTPERLQTELFQARAGRLPVSLLAVDEAHCISEWGHDFRPAYRRIAEARALLRGPGGAPVPVLAVTATATPEVRRDVLDQLALHDPAVVVRGFDRPNLVWSVHHVEDKAAKVRAIAEAVPGAGLVYAGTRRGTEAWAATLRRAGVSAEAYHAGLDSATRSAVQARWLAGATRYIAATSAFGMGVDKPDVRAVIHVELPLTVEAYYQEAGRAGRDGARAYAALLTQPGDDALPRTLIAEGHPDAATLRKVYETVASLAQVPIGGEPDGPVALDAAAIARVTGLTEGAVRAAAERLADAGAWAILSAHSRRALLRFRQPPEVIRGYADTLANGALAEFVRALLRTVHADAFATWGEADLPLLERRTGLPRERLLAGLAFLAQHDLLAFHPPGDGLRVTFPGPRPARLALDAAGLARRRRHAERQLDEVGRYVGARTCRRQFLLAYFGETASARCGRCDRCLARPDGLVTPADEPLLAALLGHVERGDAPAAWLPDVAGPKREALVDWLVHEGLFEAEDPLAERYRLTPKGLRFARRAGG